jgi:hypothetical protein
LSGIAISLAEILTLQGKLSEARLIYTEILSMLQNAHSTVGLTGPERVQYVRIAYKLGTSESGPGGVPLDEKEEERCLTFAVEEGLRVLKDAQKDKELKKPKKESEEALSEDMGPFVLAKCALPVWMSRQDIAGPLESLGAYYKRKGNLQ